MALLLSISADTTDNQIGEPCKILMLDCRDLKMCGEQVRYNISVEEAYLVERVRVVSRGNRNRPIGDEFDYERG